MAVGSADVGSFLIYNFCWLDLCEAIQELRKIFPTIEEKSLDSYAASIFSTSKKLFAVLLCTSAGIQSRAISKFIEESVTDADLPFARVYPSDRNANLSNRLNKTYTLARESHTSCTCSNHASCGIRAISTWHRMEIQNLCRDQWLVLAPIFESSPGAIPPHLFLEDGVVLPYTEDREADSAAIKFGGYSEVWAVRIHPSHQKLLKSTDPLVLLSFL